MQRRPAAIAAGQKNSGSAAGDKSRVDLVSARYPLTKLPEFSEATQAYRVMVFGRAAEKPKIWVVVDGDFVYCDLNGNGDLTEDG